MVLALAAGASLCGMSGYQAMAEWAASLGQAARRRFGCRRVNGYYEAQSLYVIRDCLVRVEPDGLERGLAAWQAAQLAPDEAWAMEGKTMKGDVNIWCTTALNDYLDFPHVGQVWIIERECTHKKSGRHNREVVLGVTNRRPDEMTPQQLLAINRCHWSIESVHYLIDWNDDEDRGRIRSGHGPANVTRLRRFAIGLLKSFQKPGQPSRP